MFRIMFAGVVFIENITLSLTVEKGLITKVGGSYGQ